MGIMLIYLFTLDRYDCDRNDMKTVEIRYIATYHSKQANTPCPAPR